MKFSILSISILFILLFTFTSCQDNDTMEESILIQTDETYIMARESENHITIRVESLKDITDNRGGEVNATDYCNISFDINNNNSIDSEIDFGYESPTKNYDICSYYFLDNDAITHCAGHPTEAVFSESFSISSESATPHLIWELTISKEEINYKRKLSFIVKTIDQGTFNTIPPIPNDYNPILFTFDNTLTFNW